MLVLQFLGSSWPWSGVGLPLPPHLLGLLLLRPPLLVLGSNWRPLSGLRLLSAKPLLRLLLLRPLLLLLRLRPDRPGLPLSLSIPLPLPLHLLGCLPLSDHCLPLP